MSCKSDRQSNIGVFRIDSFMVLHLPRVVTHEFWPLKHTQKFALCVPGGCVGAVPDGGWHLQGTSAANPPHVPAIPECVWGGRGGHCFLGAGGVGAGVAVGAAHPHTRQALPPWLVVLSHTVCHLPHHLGQKVTNNALLTWLTVMVFLIDFLPLLLCSTFLKILCL